MKEILILDLKGTERSSGSIPSINKGEKLMYWGGNLPNITQLVSGKAGVRTPSSPECQDYTLSTRSVVPLMHIGSKYPQHISS